MMSCDVGFPITPADGDLKITFRRFECLQKVSVTRQLVAIPHLTFVASNEVKPVVKLWRKMFWKFIFSWFTPPTTIKVVDVDDLLCLFLD